MSDGSGKPSDALVFFGATGDLAYKKIFPALQSMARRGKLAFPVIGVGGVRSADDVRQYLQVGASLVAIGTAALADPRLPERIVRDLERQHG